jgi:tetratricopeptide (TPR) repeat protein
LNKDLIPLLENNDEIREILIAIAIFSRIELPYFSIEIINQLTNNKANRIREKIENFIKYSDAKNVLLRNAFLEETILKSVDKVKITSVIKRILLSISSLVDNSAHTYWNEIHAGLIKEKLLRQKLKLSSSEIQNLLYKIRNYYSDNFNYWIQLGISEQREKDFEKALNHFKVAESLRPTSYMVQTSIGNNFLKQANSLSNYNIAKSYFQEGESILKKLITEKEEFQVSAYATHCLLFEKIKFYDNFKLDITNKEISQMHNQLEVILSKDDNDIMAKHINNEFYQFLKRRNKTNVIRIKMQDLSKLKYYFSDNKIDEDTLADEFELE